MEWPWQRFDAMNDAFIRRKGMEAVIRFREAYTAALYANTNYDEEPTKRQSQIEQMMFDTEAAIEKIYGIVRVENEIDESDPFWQGMKRGLYGDDWQPEGEQPEAEVDQD